MPDNQHSDPRTTIEGWAVQRVDGSIVVDTGRDITEDIIWKIALGWPSSEEIQWEKDHGGRAFRCKIEELT